MNLFTFETTISKGYPLCPKLTWCLGRVGLFVFVLLTTWSCQDREPAIEFVQTIDDVQAITKDYKLALDAEALTVALPTGEKSQLVFEEPLAPAKAIGGKDYLLSSDNYDFRLYSKNNYQAAYDLVLKPGADPAKARFRLQQAEKATIDINGNLIIPVKNGYLKHSKPISYQDINGERKAVTSQFVLDGGFLGFRLGTYDPAYPVVIDPELSFEDFAEDVFNATISLSNSTPSPRNTGTNVVYVIKYATQSNTNDFNNAQIVVNIPTDDIDFIGFSGTLDVDQGNFVPGVGSAQFVIDMVDPLPAGSTGQMELTVRYNKGRFCDGDVIPVSVTRSADNDLVEPNGSPNMVNVTLNDDTEPFPPTASGDGVYLLDSEEEIAITVNNGNTLATQLDNAVLSVDIPADVVVVSCDGCNEDTGSGVPASPITLTWNLGTVMASGPLPIRNIIVSFPDGPFEVGDEPMFNVTLTGMPNECATTDIDQTFKLTTPIQTPPPPMPRVQCVDMSTNGVTTIGATDGVLSFSFKNNSTLAAIENFTYSFEVPSSMGITALPEITFTDGRASSNLEDGLNAKIVYKTSTLAGPESPVSLEHDFVTNDPGSNPSALVLAPGFYFTEIAYMFVDPVPEGFMPLGNNIDVNYEVLADQIGGGTTEGANPRIPTSCVVCGDNFDCFVISPSVTGTFDGQNLSDGNCGIEAVLRDQRVGIQGIDKTVDRPNFGYFPRDIVTFTLAFQNCGTDPITSTVITDNLPEGLTLIPGTFMYTGFTTNPADPSPPSNAGPVDLIWNVGNLPGAATADACVNYTITFQASVNDMVAAGNLSNCFDIDGQLNGQDLDDCAATVGNSTLRDCATVRVRAVGPAGLTKTSRDLDAPTNRIFPEEVVEYKLGWRIESMFQTTDLVVRDVLPAGISFEPGSFSFNTNITNLPGYTPPTFMATAGTGGTTILTWNFGSNIFPEDASSENVGNNPRYEITYNVKVDEGVAPGNKTNCFTIEAMSVTGMGNNVRMGPTAQVCNTINIAPVGPINLDKRLTGRQSAFPTQETEYTITFRNSGPFDVPSVTISDVLPAGLEYVDMSVMYPDNAGTSLPSPTSFSYDEVSNTLNWSWASLPGADDDDITSGVYTITYRARVRPGTEAGIPLENCVKIDVDIDNGLNPNVAPRRNNAQGFVQQDCNADLTVLTLAQVDSRKGIRGECDDEFKFFDPNGDKPANLMNLNGIGTTFEGGSADYRLEICNTGNVEVEDFILVDILPWVGDIGVTLNANRESMWRPNFAGLPTINMDLSTDDVSASQFEIYYSIEQSPCRDGLVDGDGNTINVGPCTGPFWSLTPPADIARVQAIKIEFIEDEFGQKQTLGKGSKIVLEWPMFAPVNTPADIIAWNSFAYQGVRMDNMERFLVAEPNKVGIAVKDDPKASIGDYVWVDRNEDGFQNESPRDGVNGVGVTLYRVVNGKDANPGAGDDEVVATTVTGFDYFGEPGYYLFPNLDPGMYYVVFDEGTLPPTTTVIAPDAVDGGGINDDTKDSDPDQVMLMTPVEDLMAGEDNRTYDLGITPPNCDLTGTNVEKLCRAGNPGDPDDDQVELISFNVTKEKFDDRQGEDEAGGGTYTVLIESCTTTEVDGMPVVETTQLYVRTGFEYDETYAVTPEGGELQIPGLTTALAATFNAPEGTDIKISFLDEENPLCYAVEILSGCRDYGDLPDSYGTLGETGAWHTVKDGKRLGSCLDTDADGNPSATANGDDDNAGTRAYGECEDAVRGGDDEDGIEFLTPIIPGKEACIRITYSLPANTPGVVNAWIDYDGSGDFTAVDQVQFVSLTDDGTENTFAATNNLVLPDDPSAAIVNKEVIACFTVPDLPNVDEFSDGNLFARFRLSCDGDLGPTGGAPDGEVEDYFRPLGKIGNLVFEDYDFDGVQDGGEPGINGAEVTLIWAGLGDTNIGDDNDEEYTLTTGPDSGFDQGEYYFCGLLPGTYKLKFTSPDGMTPTRANIGNQDLGGDEDSDGLIPLDMNLTMVMEDPFTIADVTNLPTDEDGNGDDSDGPTGTFPNAQVDETHDQGFAALDYGDLPEDGNGANFLTTMASGGPVHVIVPGLYLGDEVDGERDGQPSVGAADDGNDEDGIVFTTPLIPGNEACIEVTAVIPPETTAVLQAWIDWNNNGQFDLPDEAVDFKELTDGILNGSVEDEVLCFDVPEGADFNGGAAYARFRLSPEGGLGPNGPDKYGTGPENDVPPGEVEDYVQTTAKVGNLVFEDYDFDGVQDEGEPGIEGVTVTLIWFGEDGTQDDENAVDGDDVSYGTLTTNQDGEYYFCGLVDGEYKLIFDTPENMTPTRTNIGSQVDGGDSDSDGERDGMDLTMVMETFTIDLDNIPEDEDGLDDDSPDPTGTFPDDQTDETHDQGFAFLDYGDLPEDGNGDDFSTLMEKNGAVHVVIPGLNLGSKVDGERNGTSTPGADGDDNQGMMDDEDGIRFNTPLIPGFEACVQVTAINSTGENAVLEAWIDWDNSGTLDADEKLQFTNNGAVNSTITNQDFCFPVPQLPIEELFNDGMVFARFRLSPADEGGNSIGITGPNGPDKYGNSVVPQGEVEDYKLNVGKLGNIVFEDYNFDGLQEGGEPGIDGVLVTLTWGGPDNNIATTGDNRQYTYTTGDDNSLAPGEYYFCGIIGRDPLSSDEAQNYKLTYQAPTLDDGSVYTATRPNVDDPAQDVYDSDGLLDTNDPMDLTMAMETFTIDDVTDLPTGENGLSDSGAPGVGTFPDDQVDETHDQGFARLDYGDLPDNPEDPNDFPTLMVENGAIHTIFPGLLLGDDIDSEADGAPDADAGVEDGGDDATNGDEDGIDFVTPLVPGNVACIDVTVNVPGGEEGLTGAVLQGWIDWDGDGQLDNEEEALDLETPGLTDFSGGSLNLNPGEDQLITVCFDVPEDAQFNEGMVFARFRLSENGGLMSGGPDKYNGPAEPDGLPIGEVEDYKLNVAKIGNLVWEDYTGDGIQQEGEPGINDVTVQLTWAGRDGDLDEEDDNVVYTVTTGENSPALGQLADGQYYFCGLIGGEDYKITVITPSDMSPGLKDQGGDEELDSDGIVMDDVNGAPILGMVMTQTISLPDDVRTLEENEAGLTDVGNENTAPEPNDDETDDVGTFPDNQVDERYDFAFVAVDYGDLPAIVDNQPAYPTLLEDDGARHITQPNKFLGTCVDAEQDGAPDAEAGLYNGGDDGKISTRTQGTCTEPGNDENGVEFPTPLVPGYEACINVTYTAEDILPLLNRAGNVYLSAWIDFNGNNALEGNERVEFTTLDGNAITGSALNVALANGTGVEIQLCFIVPGDATFAEGAVRSRFRLNCEADEDNVKPDGLLVGGEVEDYWIPVAKVGQYTWFDNDLKGDQAYDPSVNDDNTPASEVGVDGVDFVLIWKGADGVLGPNPALGGANDDRKYLKTSAAGTEGEGEAGIYYFCGLQEGDFQIVPLKYANSTNTGMTQVIGEDGTIYDISDPEDVIIIDGVNPPVSTPRYSLTPERKILTRPNDAGDDEEDSDGAPNYMFDVPDLVNSGFTTLGEDGNGDLPTIYGYPDERTNLTIDFGWVQEPNVEVLQRIVGVDFPESGTCDHFNVIVDVCMVNTAGAEMEYAMGVPLKNLQLMGDLSTQLGATFVDVVSTQLIGAGTDNNGVTADITELEYAPALTPDAPQQYPKLNPNYNGDSDKNLFVNDADNPGFIWPGEKVMVRYVFEVAPEEVDMMVGVDLNWNLMGSGKATNYAMEEIPDFFNGGQQYMAMDVSNDFTGPTPAEIPVDGTYDDPDEPTNLGDCWKKASQFAAFDQVNFTANADCKVVLEEENLIQPYYPECDEDIYPLGGYYRFRIEGTPGIHYLPTEAMAASIVNGKIRFQVQSVNKACEPRWGELLLEDKAGPVITPPDPVMLECWLVDDVLNQSSSLDPTKDNFVGAPTVTDGCEGSPLPYTWSDNIEYFECNAEGTYAVLTRRFRAVDDQGNASTAFQTITFKTVSIDAFDFEADPENGFVFDPIEDKWVLTVNECDAEGFVVGNVYPVYQDEFGRKVSLDEAECFLSLTDKVVRFDGICGDGYKEQRSYDIFDWCEGQSVNRLPYLVKVGDFEAPVFDACVLTDDELVDFDGFSLSRPMEILNSLNGNDITPERIETTPDVCMIDVSTGPMDCTASLNTDLAALRNLFGADLVKDCSDPSITVEVISYGPELNGGFPTGRDTWTIGGYVQQGPMVVGLPLGFHALVISASDDCYNDALGIVFFQVVDKVKPVMKCDDELRVTLVEGDAKTGIKGYALVSYQDVDEGSWDNCSLEKLEVRRLIDNSDAAADWEAKNADDLDNYYKGTDENGIYTPWSDIVEFFCADVDSLVKVQLRGTDNGAATGADEDNQSICWLNVNVENGLNYRVDLEPTDKTTITCEEAVTQENVMDFVTINQWGMQCAGPDVGVRIEADLDQCGVGAYLIYLDVTGGVDSKNANNVDEDPVIITVSAVHDYWIKFPADVELTCDDLEEYEGVETSADEDVACDLLATYTDTPERFNAVQNSDACYKLFVTYKVINWCEYDGESLPVIVSRDWDAHNGIGNTCNRNNDNDTRDAGEYNLNPQEPDGDGQPGDEDIYVVVEVNDVTGTGTVYYDNDSDPTNTSTADEAGDPSTTGSSRFNEGYWWAVTRKAVCEISSVWYDDEDNRDNSTPPSDGNGFDIDGSDAQDDNDNRYGSHGYWQYTQHVLVYDDTAPTVTAEVVIANDGSINNEDCAAEVTLNIDIEDECSVADLVVQVIDNSTGLPADAPIKGDDIILNADGTASTTFDAGRLEIEQTYKWTVRVNDGCGNSTEIPVEFEVEDIKAPAPICHDGLQVELMPTDASGSAGSTEAGDETADPQASVGMAAVWASDFAASPIGDCTGQGPGETTLDGTTTNTAPTISKDAYSIYRDADFTDSTYVSPFDDETVRGLIVTCDDLDVNGGMVMVRVYAEDRSENADYCLTFVQVQNNNGACGTPAVGQIAGLMSTESVEPVEGVEVQLSGAQSKMYMTNHDGTYGFNSLLAGGDYSILPHKDVEPRNGVSTFDLILIQKHILGSQLLDSPYKMIAADVNNSKSISTLDLIQLRKLILNIDQEFANNTSWRFVDADYRFSDPSNPWKEGFPEVRNVNNLDRTVLASFVAVKIGDVNESARANTAQSLAPRSIQDVVELQTEELDMRMGNVYTISFSADISEVAGYQFTMEMDPQQVEILDLKQGIAKAENFGVFTEQGVITSSYHRNAKEEIAGKVLFSLTIRAKADAALSEVLGLSSRYTASEAYSLADEDLALGLVIGNQNKTSEFALYQNTPNPFEAETMISFKLPELMEGVLEFKDISGRTLLLKEGDFAKGYNEVRLSADELPSAGVYFYTLNAGKYTATKKMILVN